MSDFQNKRHKGVAWQITKGIGGDRYRHRLYKYVK